MNTKLLSEPFIEIVANLSSVNPHIDMTYSKVRSVLRNYSESRNVKFSELKLPDLLGLNNKLCGKFLQFISHIPRPENRTKERHKRFKEEVRSNSYNLLEKIVGYDLRGKNGRQKLSFIISNIPDFLIPVVAYLTKDYWKKIKQNQGDFLHKSECLEQLELTNGGYYLLPIILKVTEDHQIKNIQELLLDYRQNIHQIVNTVIPSNKIKVVRAAFYALGKNLEIETASQPKISLNINDLPTTLKYQWELFEKRALTGWIDDPVMISLAAQNGIKIKKLEKSTIDYYRTVLLHALGYIPYNVDLDVRDLLRLEVLEVNIDGILTTKLHNSLIDVFRKHEQQKQTKHKRIGFDTPIFVNFLSAIKAIAAFNGIFHLQKPFRENYSVRVDTETRRKIKEEKKKAFPIEWIDKTIAELETEFVKIVEEGRFKINDVNWKLSESQKSLRFCFFFVILVTLRYTGFRQQCIRNCIYGKHIVFNSDKSITFRWEADEIKNDKLYKITFDPNKHSLTHGIMIRTLHLYHNKIYKYILKSGDNVIANQFFLKINKRNKPENFKIDVPNDFYNSFVSWLKLFFKEDDQINQLGLKLKPHDFRGIAADYYFSLNRNVEQTANLLGDAPRTISQEYLRNDQHIADSDLDKINEDLRRKEQHKNEETGLIQRLHLQEQLHRADERADMAEKRVGELTTLLDGMNRQLSLLQQQTAQNFEDLSTRFKSLSQPDIL